MKLLLGLASSGQLVAHARSLEGPTQLQLSVTATKMDTAVGVCHTLHLLLCASG